MVDATVIVPVKDSRELLERCLAALRASQGVRLDILIVDDGSRLSPTDLAERFNAGIMRFERSGGPGKARNAGAERVATDLLVFVDADVLVHTDTVARMVARLRADPTLTGVLGRYDDDPPGPSLVARYRNLLHAYTHAQSAGDVPSFWTGCGAIRRDVFLRAGGFDVERYDRPAIEDVELGTWLTHAGHRFVIDPDVKCKHLKQWTVWGTIKTDIHQRGTPWVDLMLRAGRTVKTLNTTTPQRFSVLLMGLACAWLLLLPVLPLLAGLLLNPAAALVAAIGLAVLIALALAGVTLLNIPFYRYLARCGGAPQVIVGVPMHWLYFVCCGLCVPLGLISWHQKTRIEKRPRYGPAIAAMLERSPSTAPHSPAPSQA